MPSEATDTITGADAAVEFRSLDGLYLRGTFMTPNREIVGAAVLVHGGGAC